MSDEEQFLVDTYPLLYSIANRLTRRPQDASDLAQYGAIAAMQLYRKRGERPHTRLLHIAARREMIDRIRLWTKRKQPVALVPINEELDAASAGDLEDVLIAGIDRERGDRVLLDYLISLATPAQQVLLRRQLAGETLRDLGAEQGVTEGRMSQIRLQAIRRIREKLDEVFVRTGRAARNSRPE